MEISTEAARKKVPDERCPHCDSVLQLVRTMLDSRSGKSVRMFKCKCGARTWDDLFSSAL
jgi:transposase-like protein